MSFNPTSVLGNLDEMTQKIDYYKEIEWDGLSFQEIRKEIETINLLYKEFMKFRSYSNAKKCFLIKDTAIKALNSKELDTRFFGESNYIRHKNDDESLEKLACIEKRYEKINMYLKDKLSNTETHFSPINSPKKNQFLRKSQRLYAKGDIYAGEMVLEQAREIEKSNESNEKYFSRFISEMKSELNKQKSIEIQNIKIERKMHTKHNDVTFNGRERTIKRRNPTNP